jgi:multidrug resistance efflux pump
MSIRLLFIVVLVASCCGACRLDSAQSAAPTPVTAFGTIGGAGDALLLGAAATGVIAEIPVRDGDHVVKGQLLVRIHCEAVEKELTARQSSLKASEALFARVQNGNRQEEIDIGVANVGFAEARSEEAMIALHRALALSEGVTITKAQVDQVKRDARITRAQLDEARARLALLRAGSRAEDILQAQHARDAASATVEETSERLNYCSVRAPIDGMVMHVSVTRGQLVSTLAPTTLLTLVDDSRRSVYVEIEQGDFSKVCPQQRATVAADGFPGMTASAVVESVGAAMNPRRLSNENHQTGRDRNVRTATLSLSDGGSNLPIGLSVKVSFASCPDAFQAK